MLKPLSQQSSTLMSNISIPELSTIDEQFQLWVGNCAELSNTQKCLIKCGVLLGVMRPEQARNCRLLYSSLHTKYNTLEQLVGDIENLLYQRMGTTKDAFVRITTDERNRDLLKLYAMSEFEK